MRFIIILFALIIVALVMPTKLIDTFDSTPAPLPVTIYDYPELEKRFRKLEKVILDKENTIGEIYLKINILKHDPIYNNRKIKELEDYVDEVQDEVNNLHLERLQMISDAKYDITHE